MTYFVAYFPVGYSFGNSLQQSKNAPGIFVTWELPLVASASLNQILAKTIIQKKRPFLSEESFF